MDRTGKKRKEKYVKARGIDANEINARALRALNWLPPDDDCFLCLVTKRPDENFDEYQKNFEEVFELLAVVSPPNK